MLLKTIAIIIAYLTISEAQNDTRIVTLSQGPVRGYKANGSEVFQFFGIPYATAPTGADRFKAPLPPPTWTNTLDAVQHNIACPQHARFTTFLDVREDCLVASVFVPSTPATNLPVVVYIHGGTYFSGDGNNYVPTPLVESQRLIAVTLNYRLGGHGFLCLGTEDIPGNAGLRDMIAGLRWVQANIANFGGNPDDVTLAGYSAGAAAADLLSLSSATEGLFHKLILDSGAHLAAWSVQRDPIRIAQIHARSVGFENTGDLDALEEFYKTVSFELLTSDTASKYNSEIYFAPCIEKDLGQEIILDDSPINIVRSSRHRNLPSLYGFGNMEGIFRIPVFDNWVPHMNEKFSDFLVLDMKFDNDSQKEELAQTVKEFYFGTSHIGVSRLFEYIYYFTDVMFAYPALRSVKLQSEAGNQNLFLYEYSFYENFVQVPGVPAVITNFPGATHCAQTRAVLHDYRRSNEYRYSDTFREMKIKMRDLWANFITTGTPVPPGSPFPSWPPANETRTPYMILGNNIELGVTPINEQRLQFWDSIYDQYEYLHPIPPTFESGSNSAHVASGPLVLNLLIISVLLFYSL